MRKPDARSGSLVYVVAQFGSEVEIKITWS
jgi:hypothetical protein